MDDDGTDLTDAIHAADPRGNRSHVGRIPESQSEQDYGRSHPAQVGMIHTKRCGSIGLCSANVLLRVVRGSCGVYSRPSGYFVKP